MEESCLIISRPSEKLLEDMVRAEANMRLSKEYIQRCDEVADIPDGWLEVTKQMQRELVQIFAKNHGFNNELSIELGLQDLRIAYLKYPNNPIFREVPVYVRENKANQGKLLTGDRIVDMSIYNVSGNELKLSDLLDNQKTNLIFAGSHT